MIGRYYNVDSKYIDPWLDVPPARLHACRVLSGRHITHQLLHSAGREIGQADFTTGTYSTATLGRLEWILNLLYGLVILQTMTSLI